MQDGEIITVGEMSAHIIAESIPPGTCYSERLVCECWYIANEMVAFFHNKESTPEKFEAR